MKTLQEVQQENRRMVIGLKSDIPVLKWMLSGCLKVIFPYSNITLSQLLLSLEEKFCIEYMLLQSRAGKTFSVELLNGSMIYRIKGQEFIWDLDKEALESQSETTQRSINRIFLVNNKQ